MLNLVDKIAFFNFLRRPDYAKSYNSFFKIKREYFKNEILGPSVRSILSSLKSSNLFENTEPNA